jgi:hypothetical protein
MAIIRHLLLPLGGQLALRELVLLSVACSFRPSSVCTYSFLLSICTHYRRCMTPHLYGSGMRLMGCKQQATALPLQSPKRISSSVVSVVEGPHCSNFW